MMWIKLPHWPATHKDLGINYETERNLIMLNNFAQAKDKPHEVERVEKLPETQWH